MNLRADHRRTGFGTRINSEPTNQAVIVVRRTGKLSRPEGESVSITVTVAQAAEEALP
jgi:hypothetical protein